MLLGLFLACHAVWSVVGCLSYAVLVSGSVWACIMATLNLRNIFLSGIWAGCRLCFAVFAAGMVSVMVLGCGWSCVLGCRVALGHSVVGFQGVLCDGLAVGVQAGCLRLPLCWVRCRPGGHEPIPRQSNKRGRRTRKLG